LVLDGAAAVLADGTVHTGGNTVGPVANMNVGFHVFEVEWDGTAATATVVYYFRATPSSPRITLKSVDASRLGGRQHRDLFAVKTTGEP